jgi:putative SOS response-associated peptidase YedK
MKSLMKQIHSVVDPAPQAGSLRYNIAPSQQVPVIVRNEERNILKPMRWGLVPSWTDDKAIWQRLINARAGHCGKDHRTSGSFQRSVI